MKQGTFVKRHRIPRPEGGVYGYEHLRVGGAVQIYGRVFKLIGADDYTRSFYQEGFI